MPRRRAIVKRDIGTDPLYQDGLVAKFINHVMVAGKKSIAERIVYGALDIVKNKLKADALESLRISVENASPLVEVKSRRVGGATYQVPIELSDARSKTLGIKNLIVEARKRSGHTMVDKLAAELMDAVDNKGNAIKKRDEMHRMAEANRAFIHVRS